MLCRSTGNTGNLRMDELVEVDPKDETIAGLLRGHYLVPVTHQPMDEADKPPKPKKADAGSKE